MFDLVKEIVLNIGGRRTRKTSVFNPLSPKLNASENKYYELFEAIKHEKVTNNRSAAKLLGYDSPEDKAYLMAMGRFRDSLLDLYFFIDDKSNFTNEYLRAHAKSIRLTLLGRLMILVGLRTVGLKLLQKGILLCKKYQITDLLEENMLRYLVTAVRFGRGAYVAKYLQEYPEIQREAETLKMAEYLVCVVLNVGNGKKRINKEGIVLLEEAIEKINNLENKWDNLRLEELKLVSNAFYFQIKSDILPLIDLCNAYEGYIKRSPFARDKHFRELYRIKLIALFYTGTYKESDACFKLGLEYSNISLSSYLNFLEIYFLICMRHKRYDQAEEIYEEVSSHKSFDLLHTANKERWMIYEPFLIFVLKTKYGVEYELQSGKESQASRIKQFLNKAPIASKDKMGLNAQILIGQILLLLLNLNNENEDAIIDRANSLKAYNYRHFKKQGNHSLKRTYYFIQFLIYVAESSFQASKIKLRAKKTLQRLNKDSNKHIDITENFETIRYEDLIDLVIQSVETVD